MEVRQHADIKWMLIHSIKCTWFGILFHELLKPYCITDVSPLDFAVLV